MNEKQRSKTFQRLLPRWHTAQRRQLPWRRTRDPYRILVSEIMLQQTQVSRVLGKYHEFLRRFPTLARLARASAASVIRAWQGMGYNNRALRLREFAQHVVEAYQGKIPEHAGKLMALPGVGRYTAHALACFAFKNHVPVVDVNIGRVLSRAFWGIRGDGNANAMWRLAERILPKRNAHRWNEALMDLGATICTARKPRCAVCPVSTACASYPAFSRSGTALPAGQRFLERLFDGLPVRIYRGRIVERLRRLDGRGSIEARHLARLVKPGFSASQWPWFASILNKLQTDGLIDLHSRDKRMFASLPRR